MRATDPIDEQLRLRRRQLRARISSDFSKLAIDTRSVARELVRAHPWLLLGSGFVVGTAAGYAPATMARLLVVATKPVRRSARAVLLRAWRLST